MDEERAFGPLAKGIVKPKAGPKLTPDRLTEFEHAKNGTQAEVINLADRKKKKWKTQLLALHGQKIAAW